MKMLFSYLRHHLLFFGILPFLIGFFVFPMEVSALRFRRPVDTIKIPLSRAYYDNNSASFSAYDYICATGAVYDGHRGTDFRADYGTPIYSGAYGALWDRWDGCPTWGYRGSRCGRGHGNHVHIDHEGAADGIGWETTYSHMILGTPIGLGTFTCSSYLGQVGSSGNSTGTHVHFEVEKYGYPFDDPFVGACSYSSGYWTSVTSGIPSTTCSS